MNVLHYLLDYLVVDFVVCFLMTFALCYKSRKFYSQPENSEKYKRAKKEVLGFKIAIAVLIVLPSALCWLFEPGHTSDGGLFFIFLWAFFRVPLFCALPVFWGYNYLLLVDSNLKSNLLLAIPFTPFVLITLVLFIEEGIVVFPFVIGGFLFQIIGWIVMQYLLLKKRDSFE